jgi:hypothetical protein
MGLEKSPFESGVALRMTTTITSVSDLLFACAECPFGPHESCAVCGKPVVWHQPHQDGCTEHWLEPYLQRMRSTQA